MITEEQIKQAFRGASPSVQAMVNSDDVFNAFHVIREKYNLHVDHAGNLAQAINATILEIVPFTELDTLLKEGMPGVDDETRRKVVQDVNDLIFVPLRNKVKADAEAKKAPAAVTPPPLPHPPEKKLELEPLYVLIAPRTPSVLEQKLGTPPPVVPATDRPAQPKPTYHGTDPYREQAE